MEFKEKNDDYGDPLIQYVEIDDLQLKCGETLDRARLGYCVFGQDPSLPLILVHPALTGSSKAFVRGKSTQGDGWWSRHIGPGCFLDTDKFQVICVDHFGGNGGSTTAKELGDLVHRISFQDTTALAVRALREEIGVEDLHSVLGGSIGGGQTLQWLFQNQIKVDHIFDISGSSFQCQPTAEFFQIQSDLLKASPAELPEIAQRLASNSQDLLGKTPAFDHVFARIINDFQVLQTKFNEFEALKLARKIGFFRFVTPLFFQRLLEREKKQPVDESFALSRLETWLDHQGELFVKRFSSEALAALCMMEAQIPQYEVDEVAMQLVEKNCQLIGFSVNGDILFDAERQHRFYQAVRNALPEGKKELVDIHFAYDEVNGHDHFLSDRFVENIPRLARHLHNQDLDEGFETRAIHRGQDYREGTGALIPPIYLTSTFEKGNKAGFDYTRSGNPNFRNLEDTLSNLESARYATVFSSGVSAITAIVSSLKSGDLVIAEEVIYGCTYRLFDKVFDKFGVSIEYYDLSNPENFHKILEKRPAVVWIETPTNPLLKILDIRELSKFTKRAGSTLVVDNTFASSYFQSPIELGADLSMSSTTKYVNGHSDCLGGVVCTDSLEWQDKMVFAQKAMGLNPSPLDCWLISRGLKTMSVRMDRHIQNSLHIAEHLERSPHAKLVRYPFLPSHPQYQLAREQMRGGSGIVTVEFNWDIYQVNVFLDSLKRFTLAESLGGIESLVCHPATMSHASVPLEQKNQIGITDSVVRFSVGIEHSDDLIQDIDQAIAQVESLHVG